MDGRIAKQEKFDKLKKYVREGMSHNHSSLLAGFQHDYADDLVNYVGNDDIILVRKFELQAAFAEYVYEWSTKYHESLKLNRFQIANSLLKLMERRVPEIWASQHQVQVDVLNSPTDAYINIINAAKESIKKAKEKN